MDVGHEQRVSAQTFQLLGYNNILGNFATLDSATLNANAALVANRAATDAAKMASFDAAREVLRGTGDTGPV